MSAVLSALNDASSTGEWRLTKQERVRAVGGASFTSWIFRRRRCWADCDAAPRPADATSAAAAAAAASAEDSTDRILARCHAGQWPDPAPRPAQGPIARHPDTFLALPQKISEARKDALTPTHVEQVPALLKQNGFVNFPPDLIAGPLLEAACKAGQDLVQNDGENWSAVFADPPGKNMSLQVGDKQKTMSPYLEEGNALVTFVRDFARRWMPSHDLARHPDGSYHIVVIHHGEKQYSGTDTVQAVHNDLPCLVGKLFSHETLQACLEDDGPCIGWFNVDPAKTIGLCVYLGSHIASNAANKFYAQNYDLLLGRYLHDHPGKSADDFYFDVWWLLVQRYVREQCPDIEAQPVLHDFLPSGGGVWRAGLYHGGLGQHGTRVFAMLLRSKDQGAVRVPHNEIDHVQEDQSLVHCKILRNVFEAPVVAVNLNTVAERCRVQFDARSRSSQVKGALLQALQAAGSEWNLHPSVRSPDPASSEVTVLGFDRQAPFVGVVCKSSSAGQPEAVLWVEWRTSGTERASLSKGATIILELTRRRGLEHVSSLVHPATPVATVALDDYHSIVSCAVFLEGDPLEDRLQMVIEPWHKRRELTEQFRFVVFGVTIGIADLQKWGFRCVFFHPNCFSINTSNHLKLIGPGYGYLGDRERPKCDRGQRRGQPTPMMRRATSVYVTDGSFGSAALQLNPKRTRRLVLEKKRREQAASGGTGGQGSAPVTVSNGSDERDSSDTSSDDEQSPSGDRGEDEQGLSGASGHQGSASGASVAWSAQHSASNLRNWSAEEDRKIVGLLGPFKAAELVIDEDLAKTFELNGVRQEALMDRLRLTDFHQIILWLIRRLRAKDESFAATKKDLSVVLSRPTVQEQCEQMSIWLHGGAVSAEGRANRAVTFSTKCQQPAALKRLCDMVVRALHPDHREEIAAQPFDHLFASTTILTADQERLLSTTGIPMKSLVLPFDGDDFKAKAMRVLKGTLGLDESLESPLELLLLNEGDMGPGVKVPGQCKKGHFFGWYIGRVVGAPRGRHVVTSKSAKNPRLKYCDGAPTWDLPFSFFIERGAPGSCINSNWNRFCHDKAMRPNLRLDRNKQITHVWNGQELVMYPMFVLQDFANAFSSWDYDPAAGGGRSL